MSKLPDSMYDYRYELPLAEIMDVCMMCFKEIFKGETYYYFDGDVICKDCLKDYIKEHSVK